MAGDASYNTINYEAQGGAQWVVGAGGTLDIYGTLTGKAGAVVDLSAATVTLPAGNATLPKITFTGLKLLAADGANSTGGIVSTTLTGAAVGDRVIAIFGQVKAETGANSFLIPVIGTAFESTISIVDKVQQLVAAGDVSLNTYLFILAPATA